MGVSAPSSCPSVSYTHLPFSSKLIQQPHNCPQLFRLHLIRELTGENAVFEVLDLFCVGVALGQVDGAGIAGGLLSRGIDAAVVFIYFAFALSVGNESVLELEAVGSCLLYTSYNGQEVQKDKIKAAHYFLESANLGYAPAMMNYGYMCASGDGIRKNLDDGLFWLLSAIENGEDGAMEYLTKYYKQNRRGEWVKKLFS